MPEETLAYYDAHCHLQDERLGRWWTGSQGQLQSLGIRNAVVNGTRPEDWEDVLRMADQNAFIIPSIGLHPWFVDGDWERSQSMFLNALDRVRCMVGEVGLDRWIDGYDIDAQVAAFRWQFGVAKERALPISIHCLKAWGLLRDILEDEGRYEPGFLLHSYGGPLELVETFADLGARFSFSGYFAQESRSKKRVVFESVPLDRLLIETDAPDMLGPESLVDDYLEDETGKSINSPANIVRIYEYAANMRGMELSSFVATIESNFKSLFGKWDS